MATLTETAETVLKVIYNDDRINTKEYTELEALKEMQNVINMLIKKRENKFSHLNKQTITI
jgi:inorganic pyrophosphatase